MDALIVVTLLVGLLTLAGTINTNFTMRENLKTTKYIDTITSERIRWREKISNEVADIVTHILFALKVHADNIEDIKNESNYYENDYETQSRSQSTFLDSHTSSAFGTEKEKWSCSDFVKNLILFKIKLNLNEDKEIIEIINYFIDLYYSKSISDDDVLLANKQIDKLMVQVHLLLKREWEKVKRESIGMIPKLL